MKYDLIPYALTGVIMLVFLSLIVMTLLNKRKENIKELEFEKQLKNFSGSESQILNEVKRRRVTIADAVGNVVRSTGFLNDKVVDNDTILLTVLAVVIGVMALVFVFTSNVIFSVIPIAFIFVIIHFIGKSKERKRRQTMDDQIPAFVSILKSNLQANQNNETALLNAIENTTDPLYSELVIAKSHIQTGTFRSALVALRETTSNETLRFLCSCVEIATEQGGRLEKQIETIEEILKSNKEIQRKIDSAASENKPLIYVSTVLLPSLFIYMYASSAPARDFWFKNVISWVLFVVIVVAFSLSIYFANKMVEKINE